MSALGGADRIAVVRALPGLGDLLCATPALRALRRARPEAHVVLVGLPGTEWFAERCAPWVDEWAPFPGFPGLPEREPDPRRIVAFLAAMQERELDLALQLHGSGLATNAFCALLGARRTAGFVLPGLPAPDRELFLPYPAAAPEPRRLLALLGHLGAPIDDEALAFPLRPDDRLEAEEGRAGAGLAAPFVLLNPGASEARRRWPVAHFASLGDALAARGLAVGVIGARADVPVAEAVAARMRAPAALLAGRTSLGAVGALLAEAALLVTNDTGASHLAAAVATPSVVVFSASDPARWAPLDAARHRALGRASGSARSTAGLQEVEPPLTPVAPKEALAAALELLGTGAAARTVI